MLKVMDWCRSVKIWCVIAWACFTASSQHAHAQTTRDYAIEVSASVIESPPRITLQWVFNADPQPIQISRKLKNETSWTSLTTVSASTTSYVDNNVTVGTLYEYGFTKYADLSYVPAGYICAGIKAPLVDARGKCLLIVENTYAADLSSELARLQQDLVGDGWIVFRRDVSRNDSPSAVRYQIQLERNANPDLRSVFLVGRVPVPYSGDYNADDHPDHTGAWAADTYYADIDGNWTDSTVNDRQATRVANRNSPGDGKYDQSVIPSNVDLEVGRVDLANMPAFLPKTEKDLLRQYLNKNHNFRHALFSLSRRAILFDGFGESGGEAYAASGWRNFSTFFGAGNTTAVGDFQFFPIVSSQGYLWSSVSGGGGDDYQSCYFVGNTSDFAGNDIQTVFTMVFGSFFGDWDFTDDFLRAPLCTTSYTLTSAWAGRPHWFFHHMALGETIGYSTRLSQNNSGLYRPAQFSREVHVALMGDPTLRMHVVRPVPNLTATTNAGSATLNWTASTDSNLAGYHVYRCASANGPFVRITGSSVISSLSYVDAPGTGNYTYMVRAIKLESSGSGTYYNASQGRFLNVSIPASAPNSPVNLSNFRLVSNQIAFRCVGQVGQKFCIERSTNFTQWTPIVTNTLASTNYEFSEVRQNPGFRFYRTKNLP